MSMELAADVYKATRRFPRSESFGLTAQARRAAVSVAANIAEGFGREAAGSFAQFLQVSQGSLKELETHLLIAEKVDLLSGDLTKPLLSQCGEIGKMLGSLIRKVSAGN